MSNRIVSDAAVEEALLRLAQLDEIEAELKASKEYGDEKKKEIYSEHFLNAEGTVAEREATARTSHEYQEFLKKLRDVTKKYQAARNERERLIMVKEIWQSENKNIRERT